MAALGPELATLLDVPLAEVSRAGGSMLGEAVARLRAGTVHKEAGYDGEYGVIRLFRPGELKPAGALFEVPAPLPRPASPVPASPVPASPGQPGPQARPGGR